MKNKFIQWQLDNKEHIMNIYNMILNDLDNYELLIKDKKIIYECYLLFI